MTEQDTAAPVAAPESAAPSCLEARIEAWFVRHFHNSIVARETELFNHVHAAKEELKRLLSGAPTANSGD